MHDGFCANEVQSAAVRDGRLDLESDPCLVLVNITSYGYRPTALVTPGSPQDSVLWHKVNGTGAYGSNMTPNEAAPQALSELASLIETWISEGAPCE